MLHNSLPSEHYAGILIVTLTFFQSFENNGIVYPEIKNDPPAPESGCIFKTYFSADLLLNLLLTIVTSTIPIVAMVAMMI